MQLQGEAEVGWLWEMGDVHFLTGNQGKCTRTLEFCSKHLIGGEGDELGNDEGTY